MVTELNVNDDVSTEKQKFTTPESKTLLSAEPIVPKEFTPLKTQNRITIHGVTKKTLYTTT